MPPAHDNVANAVVMIVDRASHTFDIDNTGATYETNEAAHGEGEESVWATFRVDPASPPFNVTMTSAWVSGTVVPYVDFYRADGVPIFDPSSPDFTSLSPMIGVFVGDGTNTPPPLSTTITNSVFGDPGAYYLFVGDWNFAGGQGVQRITYTIDADPPPGGGGGTAGPDPYLQARFPTV